MEKRGEPGIDKWQKKLEWKRSFANCSTNCTFNTCCVWQLHSAS